MIPAEDEHAAYAPRSGAVTATNASYNAARPPNGPVSIGYGFQAKSDRQGEQADRVRLNGGTCTTN